MNTKQKTHSAPVTIKPEEGLELDFQLADSVADCDGLPQAPMVQDWIAAVFKAVPGTGDSIQLTVRVVDEAEMTQLNQIYRHKTGPTNVLSFPAQLPEGVQVPLLGDIVICAPVVKREAEQQNKLELQHWAHMVVHGVLHLMGYDHYTDEEAETMETLEVEILAQLNVPNPYRENREMYWELGES